MSQIEPPPPPPPPPAYNTNDQGIEDKPSGMATASMIIGICSIPLQCAGLGFILGLVAVILGFVEKKNIETGQSSAAGESYVKTGIICGFIGLGITVLIVIAYIILLIFGIAAESF